jgi:hypothetical protein
MSVKRINSGTSLREYFSSLINESVNNVSHRRRLLEKDELFSDSGDDDSPDSGGGSSSSSDDDMSAMKKGDVESSDIIDKLNSIRSGKSFKDDNVSSNMEKYVNGLDGAEKVALLAFLKAIAQIVTAEIPAQDAMDPSKSPASVEMKKSSGGKTVTVKPTIVKKEKTPEKKSAGEDTSGPAPIQPKK